MSGFPWKTLLSVQVTIALLVPPTGVSAHPMVPGFERFYTTPQADAVRGGQLLLGELNCISCHRPADGQESVLLRKQAPVLDGVGSRVRRSFLRTFLSDPQAVKPGTTMPHVFDFGLFFTGAAGCRGCCPGVRSLVPYARHAASLPPWLQVLRTAWVCLCRGCACGAHLLSAPKWASPLLTVTSACPSPLRPQASPWPWPRAPPAVRPAAPAGR